MFRFDTQKIIVIATLTFSVIACLPTLGFSQPAALTWNAQSKVSIVLPQAATLPEQTAARELDDYLTKITGGDFIVQAEVAAGSTPGAIYVGNTKFAKRAGVEWSTLAAEEWRIKTQNASLILVGGGTRGTLYATYHFLEDVAGVRWWNPWEETVPALGVLPIPALDKREKPAFNYRDVYMTYGHDDGRFTVRSRLNRDGDAPIGAQYGGGNTYGPPYFVHTFFFILSPDKYYKDHPEWFIGNGEAFPNLTNSQLAMSNPEMRKEFLKLLRENIRSARQAAREKGLPEPNVFSVSQEDNHVKFATPADDKLLAENDGAESAILLDFVNFLADGIKDEFPDVFIDTLAYYSGEKAPTKISPRDNVIIRLTDTTSNLIEPITAPRNHAFHDNVVAWGKVAKNLRVWDYAISFVYTGLPKPTAHTYPADLRFLAANNVQGFFVEHEFPIRADMRDFKIWVRNKLLENPNLDYDTLVREFTDGFYGPAGEPVRRYIYALHDEAERVGKSQGIEEINWTTGPKLYNYLSLDFVIRSDAMFDEAERAAGTSEILLRRVRHARMPLDRFVARLHDELTAQWTEKGNAADAMPLKREKFMTRYMQSWNEQIDLRFPEEKRDAERKIAADEIAKLTSGPAYSLRAAPGDNAKFSESMLAKAIVYGAETTRNSGSEAKLAEDKDAQNGMATRYEIPDAELEKYKLPMPWGIYDTTASSEPLNNAVQASDIPGPGFHWYKMGELDLPSGRSYLYFFWSWIIQTDLKVGADEAPDQIFEVWASLKFEGPAFPHGKKEDKNAISVEKVALVRK